MVASHETVVRVAAIIRRYVNPIARPFLVQELLQVEGNYSFVTTIKLLAKELEGGSNTE